MIKINDVTVPNIEQGYTLNDRLDEELDTGVILSINTLSTEYPPLSKVEVFITNETTPDYTFAIDSDECLMLNKDSPKLYQHTISMVELTKIAERYIVDDVAFTQPLTGTRYYLDDVLQRVIDITPLEVASKHSATRLFTLDSSVVTALGSIPAPQLFFANQTVRQIADETFKYRNAVMRIKSYSGSKLLITKQDLNAALSVINPSIVNKGSINNSEYYINKLDIRMENGITTVQEVFPQEPNYITFNSEDFLVTTNDLILRLPKPIYKIDKVVMLLKYVEGDVNSAPTYTFREVDITSYVYEEELYNALTTNEKYHAVVYKQGDNKISGFGNSFPQFWGSFPTSVIENMVASSTPYTYVNPQGDTYSYDNTPTITGERVITGEYGFRVYYQPYVSMRVQVQKGNPTHTNMFTAVANQSGQTLDITRFLTNVQGTLNRLGNGDLMLEKNTTSWSNRFQVGQYTSDGWIVTSVENQVYNGFYRSKAMLTKNYNKLSQYIGVDREYRQYPIPLNNTVKRNMVYTEYLVISNTLVGADNEIMWTDGALEWMRNMFRSISFETVNQTITGVVVTPKLANSTVVSNFLMGVTKSWYKDGLAFHINFDNNIVAYYYPDSTTETFLTKITTRLIPVKYTDDDGLLEWMSVRFVNKNSYKAVSELVRNVPSVDTSGFNAIMASYPNGLYHHFTTTPYTYTDPATGNSYDYDYALLKPVGGGFSVDPILEEDLFKILITNDTSSTSSVWIGSVHNPIKKHREVSLEYLDTNYSYMTLNDLVVKKDPSETLSLTYNMAFVPYARNIVIGQKLLENNPFIVDRSQLTSNERELYLYRSDTSTYRDGDTRAKGTATLFPFEDFSATGSGDYFIITASNLGTSKSWGIADGNGNLYIGNNAVNGVLSTTLYFQFRNKL